jgi:hypothetical protein
MYMAGSAAFHRSAGTTTLVFNATCVRDEELERRKSEAKEEKQWSGLLRRGFMYEW